MKVPIAILGYGTVGSGVYEILEKNRELLSKRAGHDIFVKYVLDIRDFEGDPVESVLVKEYADILEDDSVKVVAEVMGGLEPAYSFVKKALEKGKSVVTSNKELVAQYGAELIEIAKANNVNFLFEASVGGGIPVIRPFNESLTPDEIIEIKGILNGTTNYILTKMKESKMSFSEALKLAQEKGFAESNPDADVLGHDACRKIAILSSLAFGRQVDYKDIDTKGITEISVQDMAYAEKIGGTIKLIAQCKKTPSGCFASVGPLIISQDNPLASAKGVYNAVLVESSNLGHVMFYGKGAGKLPTASAVVSDIIECVRHGQESLACIWSKEKMELSPCAQNTVQYLIRFLKKEMPDIQANFNVAQIIELDSQKDECAAVISGMTEEEFSKKSTMLNGRILNAVRMDLE